MGGVVVLSVSSKQVNDSYYLAIVQFQLSSAGLLSNVTNILSSYQGFADNGFVIAAITPLIITSPSTSTGNGPSNTAPSGTSNNHIVAIVVPVVLGGAALIVVIVGGVIYYRKRNRGGGGGGGARGTQLTSPPPGGKKGRKGNPNIWLDMETLPVPETNDV